MYQNSTQVGYICVLTCLLTCVYPMQAPGRAQWSNVKGLLCAPAMCDKFSLFKPALEFRPLESEQFSDIPI